MKYYILKRYNRGTTADTTNIIGITTDLDYAKSRQSVFCGYEEVQMLDTHLIESNTKPEPPAPPKARILREGHQPTKPPSE